MGNETSSSSTSGVDSVSNEQKKLQRSLHPNYTMRVVVKGEKCCGKTCLIRMLQQEPFVEQYNATQSIAATHLDWCYKSTNEQVRVEVWDVVDQAKNTKKPVSQELKLAFDSPQLKSEKRATITLGDLDAESYDVYKSAHAVFLVYDPRKRWTFDYVVRELQRGTIPPHVEILVVASFRDIFSPPQSSSSSSAPEISMEISLEEARSVCSKVVTGVRVIEASAKNAYGRTAIFSFLNLPFLRQQKHHLEALLVRNEEDLRIAAEEVDMVSFEQDYASHLKWANAKPEPKKETPVGNSVLPNVISSPKTVVKKSAPPKPTTAPAPPPVKNSSSSSSSSSLSSVSVVEEEDLDGFLKPKGDDEDDGWGATIDSSDDEEENHESKKKEVQKAKPKPLAEPVPVMVVVAKEEVKKKEVVVAPPPPVAVVVVEKKELEKSVEVPLVGDDDDLDGFFNQPPQPSTASDNVVVVVAKIEELSPKESGEKKEEFKPEKKEEADDDDDDDGVWGSSTSTTSSTSQIESMKNSSSSSSNNNNNNNSEQIAFLLEQARRMAEEQAKQAKLSSDSEGTVSNASDGAKGGEKKIATKKKKAGTKKKKKKDAPVEEEARPSRQGDYTSL